MWPFVACPSVGRSGCHSFLTGRKVSLPMLLSEINLVTIREARMGPSSPRYKCQAHEEWKRKSLEFACNIIIRVMFILIYSLFFNEDEQISKKVTRSNQQPSSNSYGRMTDGQRYPGKLCENVREDVRAWRKRSVIEILPCLKTVFNGI